MFHIPNSLFESFGKVRREELSASYFKENAEFLSILNMVGGTASHDGLAHYATLYDRGLLLLDCFPQYYRLIGAMLIELAELGMGGSVADDACDLIMSRGLYLAETSDMRRLDALNMLARRGRTPDAPWGDLEGRVLCYLNRPHAFARPDRSAAYGVTHFVFYLTDFGRKPVELGPVAIENLTDIGRISLLDNDIDLLAEVCLSLRFLGQKPAAEWEGGLKTHFHNFTISDVEAAGNAGSDDYHTWLVMAWLMGLCGENPFAGLPDQPHGFHRQGTAGQTLEEITQASFLMRQCDVTASPIARGVLLDHVSDGTRTQVESFGKTARNRPILHEISLGYL